MSKILDGAQSLHDVLYSFKEQDYLIIKNNAAKYLQNMAILDHDSASRAWAYATVDRLEFYVQKRLQDELDAIYSESNSK